MNVVIRTDASVRMGVGHAMRCLSLAGALAREGVACTFVSAAMHDAMAARITARHHAHLRLASADGAGAFLAEADAAATEAALSDLEPDWLVVDHYGVDAAWHARLRRRAKRIAVIDDLANRRLDADLLINQNAGAQADDYHGLLPPACELMLGPAQALLAPSFAARRQAGRPRRSAEESLHVVITMGGTDPASATLRVLEALAAGSLPPHAVVTVVLGSVTPCLQQVRQFAATSALAIRIAVDVDDMAGLLDDADIAIAAAGSTLWELCCLAVPTVAIITADNQQRSARTLSAMGAVRLVDDVASIPVSLPGLLQSLFDEAPRERLSTRASAVTDGLGGQRVAALMISKIRAEVPTLPSR